MKRLRVCVLLLSLAAVGCQNQQVANNASTAGPSTGVGQTGATPRPTANTVVNTKRPSSEDESLRADFQGTAGVTDKQYDVSAAALLTQVRSAQQGNFDRIVFEFAGPDLPSYHIEYIDKPVHQCGSGNVVPLKGDAWLSVRFSPANAHTEDGKPTVKTREMAPNHRIVKEIKATCDFEAEVEWVAGVSSPNRYRVLELSEPTRLVVDIKH